MRHGLLTIGETLSCQIPVLIDVRMWSRGLWMVSAQVMLSHAGEQLVNWSGTPYISNHFTQVLVIGLRTVLTSLNIAFPEMTHDCFKWDSRTH